MSWKKAESLRGQLLRWLLIPVLLVLAIYAWFSYRAAVETADLAFNRLLLGSAEAIAEDIEYKQGELVVDLPYAALELLESNINERIFYRIIDPHQQTVTGYEDLPLPAANARAITIGDTQASLYRASYKGDDLHLIALNKMLYGSGIANPVVVIVAATGGGRDALSQQILWQGLIRQLCLVAAVGYLLWLGLRRGLRPLATLRQAMVARGPMDLTPIDAGSVPGEVRPLIDALNQHSSRIERMVDNRTRFIADASHQMRTPIAEMVTHIDYCLRQNDPALASSTLRELRGDVERLSHLVSQLLMHARADPDGVTDRSYERLDLNELVRQATLEKVPMARKKAIDLGFESARREAWVQGNALLLHELITNLLDNAIQYTPEGSCVNVRVHATSPILVEVEDNGPGVDASERERVFERFYRGQATAASAPSGSGLGLAIVRDIAAGHRGSVTLGQPRVGPGLLVRVSIPGALAHPRKA